MAHNVTDEKLAALERATRAEEERTKVAEHARQCAGRLVTQAQRLLMIVFLH